MTFASAASPTVARASDSAASRASASIGSVMPKLSLGFCVPAIDWKTRSIGAPSSIASSCRVTCVSTQVCVGMSKRARTSSIACHRRVSACRSSEAGLTPMTASPAP